MLDLRLLGYEYPVRVEILGARIILYDAKNRLIFRPEPASGGIAGREKMQKVVTEIGRMFNEANFIGSDTVAPVEMKQKIEEKETNEKKTEETDETEVLKDAPKKRGRPRK